MPYKPKEKICEYCDMKFIAKDYRVRFCSKKCSGLNSIKFQNVISENQKNKLSKSMKKRWKDDTYRQKIVDSVVKRYMNNPESFARGEKLSEAVGKGVRKISRGRPPKNIREVSRRTASKILKRMGIGCSRCGWNKSVCDLHHIKGKKFN